MSTAREIRTKIGSVKNTRKITSAMEMVAASKMRKAQDRMQLTKPYAEKILQVMGHLAKSKPEYHDAFMEQREVKRAGFIIVSTDRGLCGGLNANLLRETIHKMRDWRDAGKEIRLCVVGRKGQAFFKRVGGKVLASIVQLGDTPNVSDMIGGVKVMLDAFEQGEIDALHVISNEFVNTMTQKPVMKSLLPLPVSEEDSESLGHHWDYIYEPEAKTLLDDLLTRFIELQVYQAVVENIACEQAAKMMAMKSATDNAGDLIKTFQLAYNKARQAAITQELAEIVGGADAL